MEDFLNDTSFMLDLDSQRTKIQFIKIILLNKEELPISELKGSIISGNLNINGSSAVRRTINLNFSIGLNEKIDLDFGLNKKINILVGYKNSNKRYQKYGDIVWFPCGIFIISNLSISRDLTSQRISLSGRDKMCLLDGTVGGKLPATVSFHEEYVKSLDDNHDEIVQINDITIFQIIQEAVQHYGEEIAGNIFINDLDKTAKMLVKYVGEDPIYFTKDYNQFSFTFDETTYNEECKKGQDVGYKETLMTYPGELILSAGDNVVTLLNKICDTLGNYEFFYDVSGKFIFRRKRTYKNDFNSIKEIDLKNYEPAVKNTARVYTLKNYDNILNFSETPRYDNIKNDFLVWGKKVSDSGVEVPIRYHLVIEEKPELNLAKKYIFQEYSIQPEGVMVQDNNDSSTQRQIFSQFIHDYNKDHSQFLVLKKQSDNKWYLKGKIFANTDNELKEKTGLTIPAEKLVEEIIITLLPEYFAQTDKIFSNQKTTILIGCPCEEWREELYRLALNPTDYDYYSYYYPEIKSEWRNLFDTMETSWSSTDNWNPDVLNSVSNLKFWFDFIDSPNLTKYSVKNIGRRMEVQNSEAKNIFNIIPRDVIFTKRDKNGEPIIIEKKPHQKYCPLTENFYNLFEESSTKASAFDIVRDLLYQHLNYSTQISLTCLPKYYLEPNDIISLQNTSDGTIRSFSIDSISLPFSYSGTMSISGIELFNKI